MSQSSTGFNEDDAEFHEDLGPGVLPARAEDRASADLESPHFQETQPEELATTPAPRPLASLANAFDQYQPPEPAPEEEPAPAPAPTEAPNLTGADSPELQDALSRYGQPPEVSLVHRSQPDYDRAEFLRQKTEEQRANDAQQTGLHRYLASNGVAMQTLPDGSQVVATHDDGAPRFMPQTSAPFQDPDTGRWLVRARDDHGKLNDVDLLATKGLVHTDAATGDQYFVGPDKQPVVIGQDGAVIARNQTLQQRRELQNQMQDREEQKAQIHADLEPVRQAVSQLQASPVQVGASGGMFARSSSVKKLENKVAAYQPAIESGTATEEQKQEYQDAQDALGRFGQDHPEYGQYKGALDAGKAQMDAMDEQTRADRARRTVLASGRLSSAVTAQLPDAVLSQNGGQPGVASSDDVANEVAAAASDRRTTQSKALPGVLRKLKADGVAMIGKGENAVPIDDAIKAALNPPAAPERPVAEVPPVQKSLWGHIFGTIANELARSGATIAAGAERAVGADDAAANSEARMRWYKENETGQFSPDNPFQPGGAKTETAANQSGMVRSALYQPGETPVDPARKDQVVTGVAKAAAELPALASGAGAIPYFLAKGAEEGGEQAAEQGGSRLGGAAKGAAKGAGTVAGYMLGGGLAGKVMPAIASPILRALAATWIHGVVNSAVSAAAGKLFDGQALPTTPAEWAERLVTDFGFGVHSGVAEYQRPGQIAEAQKIVADTPQRIQLAQANLAWLDFVGPRVEAQMKDAPEGTGDQYRALLDQMQAAKQNASDFLKAQNPNLVAKLDAKAKQVVDAANKSGEEPPDLAGGAAKNTPPPDTGAPGEAATPPAAPVPDGRTITAKLRQADQIRDQAAAGQQSGDLKGAAEVSDLLQASQEDLHRDVLRATGELPEGLRQQMARTVAPETVPAASEKHFAENSDAPFLAAEVGRQTRDLYVDPVRQQAADGLAQRAGKDAPLVEFVGDQHAGMAAGKDLLKIATGEPVAPERVAKLQELGLVETGPDGGPTVTDDAFPLLPKGLREQAKANPGKFRATMTPGGVGDVAATLTRAGQQRFADALHGREMKVREAAAAKPYAVRVHFERGPVKGEAVVPVAAHNDEQAIAHAVAKVQKGATRVTHAEVTTREKEAARRTGAAESDAAGGPNVFKKRSLDDFTQPERDAAKAVKNEYDRNRAYLAALGISRIEIGRHSRETSGLAMSADGALQLDPAQLKAQRDILSAQRSEGGKGVGLREWARQALQEEVTHALQFEAAKRAGVDWKEHYATIRQDPKLPAELLAAARKSYHGFDELAPHEQGAEIERMVLQQRWTGTITERIFQSIGHILDYLKGLKIESPMLTDSIARVEALREELLGKVTTEDRPPVAKFTPHDEQAATFQREAGTQQKGDLLQGKDAPFNLVGEKGIDGSRVVSDREQYEQDQLEAQRNAERDQGALFASKASPIDKAVADARAALDRSRADRQSEDRFSVEEDTSREPEEGRLWDVKWSPPKGEEWMADHVQAPVITQGDDGSFYVGESSQKYHSLESAISEAKRALRESIKEQGGTFGSDMDGQASARSIFEAFPREIPGVEAGAWFHTKWGSWYLVGKFIDQNGEPESDGFKLSVRDHDVSRRDMGPVSKAFQVGKGWEPEDVGAALKRAEAWLRENATAALGEENGGARFKTSESGAPQEQGDARVADRATGATSVPTQPDRATARAGDQALFASAAGQSNDTAGIEKNIADARMMAGDDAGAVRFLRANAEKARDADAADRYRAAADALERQAEPHPLTSEQGTAVREAYTRLKDETGFPAVNIADLAEQSGVPVEKVKAQLLRSVQSGRAVLSTGDWSLADEKTRAGAIEQHGQKMLQARLISNEGLAAAKANRRSSSQETGRPGIATGPESGIGDAETRFAVSSSMGPQVLTRGNSKANNAASVNGIDSGEQKTPSLREAQQKSSADEGLAAARARSPAEKEAGHALLKIADKAHARALAKAEETRKQASAIRDGLQGETSEVLSGEIETLRRARDTMESRALEIQEKLRDMAANGPGRGEQFKQAVVAAIKRGKDPLPDGVQIKPLTHSYVADYAGHEAELDARSWHDEADARAELERRGYSGSDAELITKQYTAPKYAAFRGDSIARADRLTSTRDTPEEATAAYHIKQAQSSEDAMHRYAEKYGVQKGGPTERETALREELDRIQQSSKEAAEKIAELHKKKDAASVTEESARDLDWQARIAEIRARNTHDTVGKLDKGAKAARNRLPDFKEFLTPEEMAAAHGHIDELDAAEQANEHLRNEEQLPERQRSDRMAAKLAVGRREAERRVSEQKALWADLLEKKYSSVTTNLARFWRDVAKDDDAFVFPRSSASSADQIARDMSLPGHEMTGIERSDSVVFKTSRGELEIEDANTSKPTIYAANADSSGRKQGGGAQLYQAALAWAHNNGKTIHPSNALTIINKFVRRTSNMLSSALRFGTTKHMLPDADQGVKWKKGSDGYNIAQMAMREMEQVFKAMPDLQKLTFDSATARVRDEHGTEVTPDELEQRLKRDRSSSFDRGIGRSTAQRAIITASALRDLVGETTAGDGRSAEGRGPRVAEGLGPVLYASKAQDPDAIRAKEREKAQARVDAVRTKAAEKIGALRDKIGGVVTKTAAFTEVLRKSERAGAAGRRGGERDTQAELRQADKWITADMASVKKDLVELTESMLPPEERGHFISQIAGILTERPALVHGDLDAPFRKAAKLAGKIQAKADEVYRKELADEIRDTMKRAGDSPSVDVGVKAKMKALTGRYSFVKLSEAKRAELESRQRFVKQQELAGNPHNIPADQLAELKRLTIPHISELPTAALEALRDKVNAFENLGRLEVHRRERVEQQELATDMGALAAEKSTRFELRPENADLPPLKQGEKHSLAAMDRIKNKVIVAMNAAKTLGQALLPIDAVMDVLGDAKGAYNGFLFRRVRGVIDLDYNAKLAERADTYKGLDDLIAKHKLTGEDGRRIGVLAAANQEGGRERLVKAGIPEAHLDSIIKSLTPGELEAYHYMRAAMDAKLPELRGIMRELYNEDVVPVQNYFPMIRDWHEYAKTQDLPAPVDPKSGMPIRQDELATWKNVKEDARPTPRTNVEKGFTIERQTGAATPIRIDAFEVWRRHMDDMLHLIHTQRDLKRLGQVMRSEEAGAKFGRAGRQILVDWLDTIARNGGSEALKHIAWIDWLRQHSSVGMVGYRAVSQLKHISNAALAMHHVGLPWYIKGLSATPTAEAESFLHKNMAETFERHGGEMGMEELTKFSRIANIGFAGARFFDRFNAQATALGGYFRAMAEKGYPPAEALKANVQNVRVKGQASALDQAAVTAVQDALVRMRRVVASAAPKDAPQVLSRGTGMGGNVSVSRTMFQFGNIFLDRWSNIQHDFFGAGVKKRNYGQAATVALGLLTAIAAESGITLGMRSAINTATGNHPPSEDDDHAYAKEMLEHAAKQFPFVGQIMGAWQHGGSGIPVVDAGGQILSSAKRAVEAKSGQAQAAGAIRAAGGAAALIGIPGAGQVSDLASKAVAGKQENEVQRLMREHGIKHTPPPVEGAPQRKDLVAAVRAKTATPAQVYQSAVKGGMKPKQARAAVIEGQKPAELASFERLPLATAIEVYRQALSDPKMTPELKRMLHGALQRKHAAARG